MHGLHREQKRLDAVHPPSTPRTRTVRPRNLIAATEVLTIRHGPVKAARYLGSVNDKHPLREGIVLFHKH